MTRRRQRILPPAAWSIIVLTALVCVGWSAVKLLNQDEIFELQTDGVTTVSELVRIQLHHPISLDPLLYHYLAHVSAHFLGVNAFALRLPSILGFLLMQVCLFVFVRRALSGPASGPPAADAPPAAERAALLAMALPALTAMLFFAVEARPYGLLLGLSALSLVAWQAATRKSEPGSLRAGALVTLAISIALTLNTHYFGVLLLIPLCGAELFRVFHRRCIDWAVWGAILAGTAGIAGTLPFQRAAGEFRKHYFFRGHISPRSISQAYRGIFVDYERLPMTAQHIIAALLAVAALTLLAVTGLRIFRRRFPLPAAETIFVLLLAALPFFGFLLARFVTHSVEVRYVAGALIGLSVLITLALTPWLAHLSPKSGRFFAAALCVLVVAVGALHISHDSRNRDAYMASLAIRPAIENDLLASPSQLLYMQDVGAFEVASYYQPDAWMRSHMALLYSEDESLKFIGNDTGALTAEHMTWFTSIPIVRYEDLRTNPGTYTFVLYHSGWDWTDQAFTEDHAAIQSLGPVLAGDAAKVTFPAR